MAGWGGGKGVVIMGQTDHEELEILRSNLAQQTTGMTFLLRKPSSGHIGKQEELCRYLSGTPAALPYNWVCM